MIRFRKKKFEPSIFSSVRSLGFLEPEAKNAVLSLKLPEFNFQFESFWGILPHKRHGVSVCRESMQDCRSILIRHASNYDGTFSSEQQGRVFFLLIF